MVSFSLPDPVFDMLKAIPGRMVHAGAEHVCDAASRLPGRIFNYGVQKVGQHVDAFVPSCTSEIADKVTQKVAEAAPIVTKVAKGAAQGVVSTTLKTTPLGPLDMILNYLKKFTPGSATSPDQLLQSGFKYGIILLGTIAGSAGLGVGLGVTLPSFLTKFGSLTPRLAILVASPISKLAAFTTKQAGKLTLYTTKQAGKLTLFTTKHIGGVAVAATAVSSAAVSLGAKLTSKFMNFFTKSPEKNLLARTAQKVSSRLGTLTASLRNAERNYYNMVGCSRSGKILTTDIGEKFKQIFATAA